MLVFKLKGRTSLSSCVDYRMNLDVVSYILGNSRLYRVLKFQKLRAKIPIARIFASFFYRKNSLSFLLLLVQRLKNWSPAPNKALPSSQINFIGSEDQAPKEEQAFVLINQGKLQDAEDVYKELIEHGTSNPAVYGNLAAICGIQGRPADSLDLYKKTLQLKTDYPDVHYNMGVAYMELGDVKLAVSSYAKAIKTKPNHPEAHNNLGVAFMALGDVISAIASYNKALELRSDYPEAHNNLGVALRERGDFGLAIASYNKAIELRPNYPDACISLDLALKDPCKTKNSVQIYRL